jgi:hypothetical protein
MKAVKLTKRMLKMHPADLLVKIGAVDKDKKQAYPGDVYFSREDYQELKKNLKESAKKESEFRPSTKRLAYIVSVELLNYGPNESLGDAIRPGWALVDEEAIEKVKGN